MISIKAIEIFKRLAITVARTAAKNQKAASK
jgi:hypothetical protein